MRRRRGGGATDIRADLLDELRARCADRDGAGRYIYRALLDRLAAEEPVTVPGFLLRQFDDLGFEPFDRYRIEPDGSLHSAELAGVGPGRYVSRLPNRRGSI